MLPRECFGHFDQGKVRRTIPGVAQGTRSKPSGRHVATRCLRGRDPQLVVDDRLEIWRHLRQSIPEAHDVEIAALHRRAGDADVGHDDVDRSRVAGGKPAAAGGDSRLQALMEVVRVQEKFLREDGVDLAGGVDRGLEEDVGAVRVGQKNLIGTDEQVPHVLAVAVAVLDVAQHRLRGSSPPPAADRAGCAIPRSASRDP